MAALSSDNPTVKSSGHSRWPDIGIRQPRFYWTIRLHRPPLNWIMLPTAGTPTHYRPPFTSHYGFNWNPLNPETAELRGAQSGAGDDRGGGALIVSLQLVTGIMAALEGQRYFTRCRVAVRWDHINNWMVRRSLLCYRLMPVFSQSPVMMNPLWRIYRIRIRELSAGRSTNVSSTRLFFSCDRNKCRFNV